MRKHFLSLLFTTAIPVTSLLAQEATPLSLQQSIDYALKHNYTVKNSRIDVKIQKAQNNQTLSAAYPHINGKVELDDFTNPQKQFVDGTLFGYPGIVPISLSVPFANSASVSASQILFDGSVLIALKARNTVMELARQGKEVTEETVRYNVIKSYNSLFIAERQYSIIKSSLAYARQLESDMNKIHDAGLSEKIDVERTSVQVNNLESDSMRIHNLLTVTEKLLKYQMGMNIDEPIVLTDTSVEERKQQIAELLLAEESYEQIPEYKVMETTLKLNQYNVQRYKLAAIPTLSIFGSFGDNIGAGNDQFYKLGEIRHYESFSLVGLQLNVPIFNGFLRKNQVWEAKLNVQKSENNIEYMKQTIDFQTSQSRSNLQNAVLQVQTQKRNLDLANDVLDLAQRKYKAGVGSNQEVTQAQTDQLRAQTNYFNALLDLINAEADLRKALGLLK